MGIVKKGKLTKLLLIIIMPTLAADVLSMAMHLNINESSGIGILCYAYITLSISYQNNKINKNSEIV